MQKAINSRLEELARIKKKEEKRFVQAKQDATKERELKTAALKALRLEEESKSKKIAEKTKKPVWKKK